MFSMVSLRPLSYFGMITHHYSRSVLYCVDNAFPPGPLQPCNIDTNLDPLHVYCTQFVSPPQRFFFLREHNTHTSRVSTPRCQGPENAVQHWLACQSNDLHMHVQHHSDIKDQGSIARMAFRPKSGQACGAVVDVRSSEDARRQWSHEQGGSRTFPTRPPTTPRRVPCAGATRIRSESSLFRYGTQDFEAQCSVAFRILQPPSCCDGIRVRRSCCQQSPWGTRCVYQWEFVCDRKR